MKNLFVLTLLSFGLYSCASHQSDTATSARGPASVQTQKETVWGKALTQNEVEFLEEVENSPSQSYK